MLAKGMSPLFGDYQTGYDTLVIPFVFDFGDLGVVDAYLDVTVIELSQGKLEFKVDGIKFEDTRISVDESYLKEICNDETRAVYQDIEQQVIKKWVNR